MLIEPQVVRSIAQQYNITIKGILHVGAHECEEKKVYNSDWNVTDENIIWVDANPKLVELNKSRGISNCFTAVLDERVRNTTFKITNNGQSSSILELGTHKSSYPNIYVTETLDVKTKTLGQFFNENNLDPKKYNVWNFDIQGAELAVFRGATHLLRFADIIYTEVNTDEVYKGCGLMKDVDALLADYGLRRVATHMTGAQWGDAIYVRLEQPTKPYGTMTLAIPTMDRYDTFLHKYLPKYLELPQVDVILIGDENGNDIEKIKQQPWGNNSKFRFIKNPERLGAYHNKVNLLRNITTDWVALIDSDNELLPEYFDKLYEYWQTNGPNEHEVYIPADLISIDIRSGHSYFPIQQLGGVKVDKDTWNTFLNMHMSGYAVNLGNCVFPRSAVWCFEKDQPKDLYVECKMMNKMLVENGYTLVIVPGMKYNHIVHDGSLYLSKAHEMTMFDRSVNWTI